MSLYSSQWFRVARLVPALPASVRLHRHRVRGQTWQVLADPLRGRQVRLNPAAYALAARLDGRRTVDALWQALQALGDEAPTQDETLALLMTLHRERLVRFDREPDFGLAGAALPPHAGPRHGAGPRGAGRLLAWRLPLGDPSRLLARLAGPGRALFSRAAAVAWLAAMVLLVGLVALQRLAEPIDVDGHQIVIGPAVGIALYPTDGQQVGTLQKSADLATAKARRQGKGSLAFFSAELDARSMERLTLTQQLRRGLERGEFRLHYQPKLDLRSGAVTGAAGPDPLAAPGARPALPRHLHRSGRGKRPHRRAGRLGGGRGLRAERAGARPAWATSASPST